MEKKIITKKFQTMVALSTIEAEYIAVVEAAKEIIWGWWSCVWKICWGHYVPEMSLVETWQVNRSWSLNAPDMFLPVSRYPRPQCLVVEARIAASFIWIVWRAANKTLREVDNLTRSLGALSCCTRSLKRTKVWCPL